MLPPTELSCPSAHRLEFLTVTLPPVGAYLHRFWLDPVLQSWPGTTELPGTLKLRYYTLAFFFLNSPLESEVFPLAASHVSG